MIYRGAHPYPRSRASDVGPCHFAAAHVVCAFSLRATPSLKFDMWRLNTREIGGVHKHATTCITTRPPNNTRYLVCSQHPHHRAYVQRGSYLGIYRERVNRSLGLYLDSQYLIDSSLGLCSDLKKDSQPRNGYIHAVLQQAREGTHTPTPQNVHHARSQQNNCRLEGWEEGRKKNPRQTRLIGSGCTTLLYRIW